MIKIKFFIPIFCFLVYLPARAQNDSTRILDKSSKKNSETKIKENIFSDFKPGYIVLLNGDTVSGMIDYRNDIKMSKACRFIPRNATLEVNYKPDELKAFRFENGKFFISRDAKTEDDQTGKLFLEYLIHGKMNVYYYKDSNGNHYLIDKEGSELIELPYEEKIKRDSTGFNYLEKSTRHIGILLLYMQDSPAMTKEISESKEPSHESLIKLAKDYHKSVCGDYSCIVYEKKESLIRWKLEYQAGIQNIGHLVPSEYVSNNYFTTGVIVKLGQPRVDENIFLKTGLLYARLDNPSFWIGSTQYASYFSNCYKIPLQVEYILQKGIIQPRIGYGLNFYFPIFSTVSVTPGFDIKLNKKFALTINSDIEFVPDLLFIPQTYLGVTLTAGISYAF